MHRKAQSNALAPAAILVYVGRTMHKTRVAKFKLGQVVRHRLFPFRGVVFDIDPEFSNTEEWYQSIPAEVRPDKDQPFYHLFAENAESEYIAYVSEQNLLPDTSGEPVRHPQIAEVFDKDDKGRYRPRNSLLN
jgi:heat shock protein HspQ